MDKLFDFTFDYLITRTILKVLYAIFVALLTIGVFVGVILNAREGYLPGIIGVVIAYLIVLLLIRVLFEDRLVKFQMAEDIRKIRENLISADQPRSASMGHNQLVVQNIALWLGSGLLGYAIWAFVWRDEFDFKTRKDSHLIFLLIFLAVGWFGLAYWFMHFYRRLWNG